MFDDPKDSTPCKCIACKWEGTLKDARKQWYSSPGQSWMMLAGREGWEWKCPKCGFTVHSHWYKVS